MMGGNNTHEELYFFYSKGQGTSGTDSPPPPILKIQSPVRSGVDGTPVRSTPMATQRQGPGHLGKGSTSSSNTSNSSSPSHNSHSHQILGHHSPDITLGSQLLTGRRWSNSDSDDEELMDINEAYVSDDAFSATEKSKMSRLQEVVDGGNSTPPLHSDEEDDSPFSWTAKTTAVYYRILFEKNFNPVGPQRHFCMGSVQEEFCKTIKKQVEVEVLWDHLRSLYDFKEMAKLYREKTPFEEFTLPSTLQKQAIEYSRRKAAEEEDQATN